MVDDFGDPYSIGTFLKGLLVMGGVADDEKPLIVMLVLWTMLIIILSMVVNIVKRNTGLIVATVITIGACVLFANSRW